MGKLLPEKANVNGEWGWQEWFAEGKFKIEYQYNVNTRQEDTNEANARAKCLIWLIENNKMGVKNE